MIRGGIHIKGPSAITDRPEIGKIPLSFTSVIDDHLPQSRRIVSCRTTRTIRAYMYIHEPREYSAKNNRDTHGFLLCLVALSPPSSHATSYSIHPPPLLPPSRSHPHALVVVVLFRTILLHSFAPSRYSLSSPFSRVHTHAYGPLRFSPSLSSSSSFAYGGDNVVSRTQMRLRSSFQ